MQRIATGGMGEIYLARQEFDAALPAIVAIKRLRRCCADDPRIVTMFREEALISCALDHPNVVQVWELGQDEDGFYLVMEHVPGLSLHSCLRDGGALPLALALRIACDVAAGLHHAHEQRDGYGRQLNLVHRDISPGNVLLSRAGDVKLADFGIAKFKWSRDKTEAGVIKGKYTYLSPEQARGEPLDRRSDVFGLGLLLLEMVTGRRAYRGDELDVIDRAARGAVEPLGDQHPAALRQVLARALASDPSRRPASCAELREALQAVAHANGGLADRAAIGALVQRLAGPAEAPGAELDLEVEGSVTDARGEVQPQTQRIRHRFVRWAPVAALAVGVVAAVLVATWPIGDRGGALGLEARALSAATAQLPAQPIVEPVAPLVDAPGGPPAASPTRRSRRSEGRPQAQRRAQGRGPATASRRADRGPAPLLSLATVPPTEVLLGSRVLGSTPLRTPFPPGKRRLRLTFRNRELGLLRRRTVTARQARRPLTIAFAKGRIAFAIKPGKLVRLDGRTLGMSPLKPVEVYEGTHVVLITSPFRYATERRQVTVKPAATATVSDP